MSNSPALVPLLFIFSAVFVPLTTLKKQKWAYPLTLIFTFISLMIVGLNIYRVMEGEIVHYYFGGHLPPVGIEYVLDKLTAYIILVINVVSFVVLLHSKNLVRKEIRENISVYYALALLMLAGCNGMVLTGDLFNLYVFLEISALSFYGLIATGGKESYVAAFRYLIMGSIGASLYLLGMGMLYMKTGSLNMIDVGNILGTMKHDMGLMIAVYLMFIGIGLKMALFPLYAWLPDSYTYASSTSSALIAPVGTKIASYVLFRLMFFIFGVKILKSFIPFLDLLAWPSAVGIIFGSVMAITQTDMKKMLSYSSVAQIGYIGLGFSMANPFGIIGALLHLLNHSFMKAGLFMISGNLKMKLGHTDISRLDQTLSGKMPWTAFSFTVFALSMIGLPPLAGFFSKWYLLLGALKNSSWIFVGVILLSALLNAAYFFRVIERIYIIKKSNMKTARDEVSFSMIAPTLITAFAIILLGLLNVYIVKGFLQNIATSALG